jgi:hypothetical protein
LTAGNSTVRRHEAQRVVRRTRMTAALSDILLFCAIERLQNLDEAKQKRKREMTPKSTLSVNFAEIPALEVKCSECTGTIVFPLPLPTHGGEGDPAVCLATTPSAGLCIRAHDSDLVGRPEDQHHPLPVWRKSGLHILRMRCIHVLDSSCCT